MAKKSRLNRNKSLATNDNTPELKNKTDEKSPSSDWSNNFWLPLLVVLIAGFIALGPIQHYVSIPLEHIKVKKIDIRNTPMFIEQEGVQNDDYYDSLVENIVYFSGTKSPIVDKVVLKNVRTSTYEYSDLEYISNFDIPTQTFKLHFYQNGNANDVIKSFRVDLIKTSGGIQKQLDSFELGDFEFDKGDVHTVADFDIDKNVLKHFGKEETEHLLIKIYHDDINDTVADFALYYNSQEGRFQRSGIGGGLGGQPYEILNLFEITSPYKLEFNKITVSPVSEKDPLKINLLFGETKQYDYDLEIYSNGEKIEIPDDVASQSLKVRFPNYDLVVMSQELHQLMERLQVIYLSGEDVKFLLPESTHTLEKFKKYKRLQNSE